MNTDSLSICVECYDDQEKEETPRLFFMGDKSIEIEEIIDCWLAPECRYFKVRGDENAIYILRHDKLSLSIATFLISLAIAAITRLFPHSEKIFG
jgi:hypothetical protein